MMNAKQMMGKKMGCLMPKDKQSFKHHDTPQQKEERGNSTDALLLKR